MIPSSVLQTAVGLAPEAGMPSNTDPFPTASQLTMVGSGAHGVWLDTRSISAITGECGLASSIRWKAERMYWSGIWE